MRAKFLVSRYGAAVLAGLMVMAAGLPGCSGSRSEQYRIEGDTYLNLGKVTEARDSFERSIAANSENPLAELGLGRCAQILQEPEAALEHYERALELDPALEEPYIESLQVYLTENRIAEAYAVLDRFDGLNPEFSGILKAFLMINEGRVTEVVSLLEELKSDFPDSEDVRVNLAMALILVGDVEEAESELKAVLETLRPSSLGAQMTLIDLYALENRLDPYVAALESRKEQSPDDSAVVLALARALVQVGRIPEVEDLLATAAHLKGDPGWGNYVKGCLAIAEGQFSAAVQHLQVASRMLPRQSAVAHKLSIALRRGGLPDSGVTRTAERPAPASGLGPAPTPVSPSVGGPVAAAVTLSPTDWQACWKQGAIGTIVDNYEAMLAGGGEGVSDAVFASAVFANQYEIAEPLLDQIDPKLRDFFPLIRDGNLQGMIDYFEEWEPEAGQSDVIRINMLGYGLSKGRARARGIQVLSQCLAQYPEDAVSLFNITQAFRRARTPEFAARTIQRQIAMYPQNTEAHTTLYVTLREGNLLDEARQAAETSYTLFPQSVDAIRNLTQSYLDDRELELAEAVLTRGMAAVPGDDSLKLVSAGILMHQERAEEALAALEKMEESSALKAPVQNYRVLAAGMARDWEEARSLTSGGAIEEMPFARRFIAAAANVHAGDLEAAKPLILNTNEEQPLGGRLGLTVLAALGGDSDGLDATETSLATALGNSTTALSDLLLAAGLQVAQFHDGAITALMRVDEQVRSALVDRLIFASLARSVSRTDPRGDARALLGRSEGDAAAWLLYANVMHQMDNPEEEFEAIQKAIEIDPGEPRAWMQHARYVEKRDGAEAATESYRRLIALVPEDPAAQNNLAYCLLITGGHDEEALTLALKAKEKLSTNPGVLHTLGVAQLRTGDLDNSDLHLRAALEIRPGDPTLLLDYGNLLLARGDMEQGQRYVALALQYAQMFGLDFPRKSEAESLASAAP